MMRRFKPEDWTFKYWLLYGRGRVIEKRVIPKWPIVLYDKEDFEVKELHPIVCIGTTNGIDVNAFVSSMKSEGKWNHRPCVEIRRMNSVQMRLPDVEAVIDLLQEALAYWQEEEPNIEQWGSS